MPTYAWVSPTSTTDSLGVWTDDAQAIDGNWNTFAHTHHGPPYTQDNGLDLTPYLQLNLSALMWVDRVRFKYDLLPQDNGNLYMQIEIWNNSTATWDNVIRAKGSVLAFNTQHTMLIAPTFSDKLRVRAYISGTEIDLYELDVEQVTPDSPNVPPPPDPSTIQQEIVQQDSTAVVCVDSARVRGFHRTTSFVPVVVG